MTELQTFMKKEYENWEKISEHILAIQNTIDTICMGFQTEQMEQQATDCMLCLGDSIQTVYREVGEHMSGLKKWLV